MPEMTTIKDYDIHVYWDSRAEYFVAEIQEILTCAADGATQAEAVSNLGETFAVLKEAYAEEKLELPGPSPRLPISVKELSALTDVVKISRLAALSGIPGQTLATKLRRGTELSAGESNNLARVLGDYGLALKSSDLRRYGAEVTWHAEEQKDAGHFKRKPGPDKRYRESSGSVEKRRGKMPR
jgi:predicted RNase H-like HicB family nuclease